MNIQSVQIYGFGKYQDDTFQFGPGFNLVEGNNEAGKSTLLSFIKAILFGFESKRTPESRYEPLKGGNFGGAVELLTSKGEVYRIERVGHRKSQGLVRVFLPNGETKGEEAMAPLLGGLSPQFYASIQAFGLSELSYLDSLYDDQTEAYLYQAGTGVTMRELEKHAAEETDKLFKPKGNLPMINQLLTQLEETDKQIKQLQKENESYQQLVLEKIELDTEIESLQQTMETQHQALKMWEKLAETFPLQTKIDQLRQQLSQYPDVPSFPTQGLERVERLLEKISDLDVDVEEAKKKMESLEQELAGLTVQPKLLTLEERIYHLYRQVPLWEERKNQLQGLTAQLEECTQNLQVAMECLGLNNLEDQLATVNLSIIRKEQVKKQAQVFSDLHLEHHSLSTIYHTKREEWRTKQREWKEAKEQLSALPTGENLDECEAAFNTYQKLFQEWESERKEVNWLKEQWQENNQTQKGNKPKSIQAAVPITLMLTVVFSISTALYLKTLGIPILLAFVGILVSLFYWQQSWQGGEDKRQMIDLKRRWIEKEKQVQARQEAIFQMAQKFQGETSPEKIAQKVTNLRKQRGRYLQVTEKARWLEEVYNSLKRDVEKIEKRLAGIQTKEDQELAAWEASLATWGFPLGTSPDGAMDWIAAAEKAKDLLKKKGLLQERKNQLHMENQAFEEDIQELLNELSLPMKEENNIQQFLFLKQLLKEHRQRQEKAENMKEHLTALKDLHNRAALQKQKYTEELSHLFALATVQDEEQFRLLDAKLRECRKLEDEAKTLQSALNATLSHPEWKQKLAEVQEEDLMASRNRCVQSIEQLRQRIQENLDLRGQLRSRIQELESGERLVNMMQQQQEFRAQAQVLAKKWIVYRITGQLLTRTRDIYESEKQPQVLREASRFFQMVTKGKYQKIVSPLGEKRILVERNDGMRLEPRFLSRGTKEQLFLSLRFALVRENSLSQALPVILDDILVNFDESRVKAFLPLLQNIAKEHQILFFTCHHHLSSMLRDGLHHINYIDLNEQKLIAGDK